MAQKSNFVLKNETIYRNETKIVNWQTMKLNKIKQKNPSILFNSVAFWQKL